MDQSLTQGEWNAISWVMGEAVAITRFRNWVLTVLLSLVMSSSKRVNLITLRQVWERKTYLFSMLHLEHSMKATIVANTARISYLINKTL